MPTINALYIPADPNEAIAVKQVERDDIKQLQAFVGGSFEIININEPPCTFFFNEEGRIHEMPENESATLLLRAMAPAFITESSLLGDVLILGAPDADGNDTSVPTVLCTTILSGQYLVIEVKVEGNEEWVRMDFNFDTWLLAYMAGVELARTFEQIVAVRVLPKP